MIRKPKTEKDTRAINFNAEGTNCRNTILLDTSGVMRLKISTNKKVVAIKNTSETAILIFRRRGVFISSTHYKIMRLIFIFDKSILPTPIASAYLM